MSVQNDASSLELEGLKNKAFVHPNQTVACKSIKQLGHIIDLKTGYSDVVDNVMFVTL